MLAYNNHLLSKIKAKTREGRVGSLQDRALGEANNTNPLCEGKCYLPMNRQRGQLKIKVECLLRQKVHELVGRKRPGVVWYTSLLRQSENTLLMPREVMSWRAHGKVKAHEGNIHHIRSSSQISLLEQECLITYWEMVW